MANRSGNWTAAVLMIELGGLEGMAKQPKDNRTERAILLKVLDDTEAPQEVLLGAEQQMARIFQRFGVDVVWQYPEEVQQDHLATGVTNNKVVYHLRILQLRKEYTKALDQRAAGFAAPGGRLVSVFYDRVKYEVKVAGMPEDVMLAYVISHELGHTLLPAGCRAAGGVMSAHLEKADWRNAQKGWLGFTDEEASRMLAALNR